MGKKGNWFWAVKKALSPDSKEKKEQKTRKSKKKWFSKHKDLDLVSSSAETTLYVPAHPPIEDVKLTEAENEQSKHAYSVALATAVAAEAAVAAAQAAAEVVRLTTVSRFSGKSKEEVAAIKIQTAFRGYMARRALRALRGLVRLKSLIQGQSVKRQATTTLRCMQTLARVQSQIRARRIRMSEENQALQRQLQQKHDREVEKLRASMGEEWNDSMQSKEKVEAKLQSKQDAAMRRERALAYAYSHQQMWKNSSKTANPTFMDPNNPHWGWSWLERWMAARPWESRSAIDKELNSDHASIKSAASRGLSVGEISKAYSRRDLNLDNKPSPTAQKLSHPPSRQSPSTPTSLNLDNKPSLTAQKLSRPPSRQSPSTPTSLNLDNKPSPTAQKLSRPPSRQSPSTPTSNAPSSSYVTAKTKAPSPKGSAWGGDDDLRSMLSAQSERYRRHSIAGSSVRDDESLASSPSVPSYMASTESAKAKSRFSGPLNMVEKNGTPERGSAWPAKKRLSFPGSPSGPRRHF